MPQGGDIPILVAIDALADHGMALVRAVQIFRGGCMAYSLIQIHKCSRRVIIVRLWDLKSPDYFTDHCVT